MPIIALSEKCIWVILFIINLILAWIIGDTMEYKEALFYWRKKKNISKYRLSALTGISESHLRNLENGIKQPNYSTIVSIADALELSLSEFFISTVLIRSIYLKMIKDYWRCSGVCQRTRENFLSSISGRLWSWKKRLRADL